MFDRVPEMSDNLDVWEDIRRGAFVAKPADDHNPSLWAKAPVAGDKPAYVFPDTQAPAMGAFVLKTKTCTKCGKTYPATPEYFHRDKAKPDGIRSACKTCLNTASREWHRNNLEKAHAASRRWTENNRERKYELNKRYYEAHREDVLEKRRRWAEKNRDRVREYGRKRMRAHPEKMRELTQRRRARLRKAKGTHTADDIRQIGDRQGWRCWYCQKDCEDDYHVDHRVPLSRGGSNGPGNLVIACPDCNMSKHARLPHEFNGRLL